jgi:ferredoxin
MAMGILHSAANVDHAQENEDERLDGAGEQGEEHDRNRNQEGRTPVKSLSSFDRDLCVSCGNCARCPYQAITLDEQRLPASDPAKCIGCSICAKKCFVGAIAMRARTPAELAMLAEQ